MQNLTSIDPQDVQPRLGTLTSVILACAGSTRVQDDRVLIEEIKCKRRLN